MAKLIIIAALGKNNELGLNNALIWHLKGDLTFFKNKTMNHKIVMGYNTFKSLKKPLKGREHLVLTHHHLNIENIKVFNDFSSLINYLASLNEEVYIIGGSSIYKLFLPFTEELLLTEINASSKADVYFPTFDKTIYQKEIIDNVIENNLTYSHVRYRKKE